MKSGVLTGNLWLRRAIISALVVALSVTIAAVISLSIQGSHNRAALSSARAAIQKATSAVQLAQTALAHDAEVLAVQHIALVESCQRLNILRRQDNLSHEGDFEVFRFVLHSSQAPRHETRAQQRLGRMFHVKLQQAVQDKTWTPATNCTQAVLDHGARYQAPQPIPFTRRLPPPSALPGG